MAGVRWSLKLFGLFLLLAESCQILAGSVTTNNPNPVVNEFSEVLLSCITTYDQNDELRVEWKKLNAGTDLVYFENELRGDLIDRAKFRESSIYIHNVTRKDTAVYRCEVVHKEKGYLGDVSINLTVQVKPIAPKCAVPKSVPVGKTAILTCNEHEGYPPSTYTWYRNGDVLPGDPKSNPKFLNSSYKIDSNTGTLRFTVISKLDIGEYHCVAENNVGHAKCEPQHMEVYDINIAAIIGGVLVVVLVLMIITVVIRLAYKRGYFAKKQPPKGYQASSKADDVDYVRSNPVDDEGDFRHKSSFVI
ncbi:junctional adhesion molecule 3B [Carcharodon carcharias]|uniref:junctional adhesion molecule 3B n=1 Tax=Carcharodon carcharias TaxID=13397 RepID=UPI001B7DB94E|nr:junctional adhesion molecule 3B [Carcharodon carcharias]